MDRLSKDSATVGNKFVTPHEQLILASQRNKERGWGFTEADFAILCNPPEWPSENLSAIVLDITLDTVAETLEEGWHFAASRQPAHWRWSRIKSDSDHLRLSPGLEHHRGLRWQLIDLAGRVEESTAFSVQQSSPSAVLWAASYFPKWIQLMDGAAVPYVLISGYQLTVSPCHQWRGTLLLYWNPFLHRLEMDATESSVRQAGFVMPRFVEQIGLT